MNIYLMRHPQRESTAGRCIGQTGVPLSDEGRATLPLLARCAAGLSPVRVVSSDLQRCRLLADEIARASNLTVETNPQWREIHFGNWENRTWDDIERDDAPTLAAWMKDFVDVVPTGGESFRQLQARALSALESVGEFSSGAVIVVTHSGVIRSLMSAFSGVPLTRVLDIPVPYGSLTQLGRCDGKWALLPGLSQAEAQSSQAAV
jgi:alpha-ribazole phosphatase